MASYQANLLAYLDVFSFGGQHDIYLSILQPGGLEPLL